VTESGIFVCHVGYQSACEKVLVQPAEGD
jgi:hypothetical protein